MNSPSETKTAEAVIRDLAAEYAVAKAALDQAMEAEKTARDAAEEAETKLFDALEGSGLKSVRIDELGLFSRSELAWASVEDEAKARAWAQEYKPELMLLNRQRLTSVVRQALKDMADLPDGVSFTTSRKINWTRR